MNHLPSAKFRRALHPHGANLEFRDSCCRVGRRVGENVGSRLPEVKRDEEDARVHPASHLGGQDDGATARGYPHPIAILDFDVHQCNGTIDIFKNDPEVMVCTSFQYPFYPWRYLDTPYPNVVHTPLPAGTESAGFRAAIERDWWPALEDFRPELILVSAGFDAHRDDPMAELCLADEDYHWITQGILDIARRHAEGRVVSVLEGGYDLAALGRSVEAHLRALLGLAYQP